MVVGISGSLLRYVVRRRKGKAVLIRRVHELAIRHGRYGYRRVAILLRREYNDYRPHSSLDYLTPAEFARQYYENKQAGETAQPGEMAGVLLL